MTGMNSQRDALAALMASIHSDADSDKKTIEEAGKRDGSLCKYWLAGLCPHKLLEGSRLGKELGVCNKTHDERLQKFYREQVDKGEDDHGYQRDLLAFLDDIISRVDRRAANDKRIADDPKNTQPIPKEIQEALDEVEAEIALKKQEQNKHKEDYGYYDKENDAKQRVLEDEARRLRGPYVKIREKQDVCMLCGAVLNKADMGTAGHTDGKLHQGMKRMREYREELQGLVEAAKNGGGAKRGGSDNRGDSRDRRRRSRSRGRRGSYDDRGGRDRGRDDRDDYRRRDDRRRDRDDYRRR